MTELSLHLLDIANNSLRAGASLVHITVTEDTVGDRLTICVADNGCGMTAGQLTQAAQPTYTTRASGRGGMGLALLKQAAEQADGSLEIRSEAGQGTEVMAAFAYNSPNRLPLGDLPATITALLSASPEVELIYTHVKDDEEFQLDTRELRLLLEDADLANPERLLWIREYIAEGLADIGCTELAGE